MAMELTFREMTLLNCAAIEQLLEQSDSITVIAGKGRSKRPVFSVNKLVALHNKLVEVKEDGGDRPKETGGGLEALLNQYRVKE